jgi:transcriptional regulator with XRE-family HTH domain
MIIGERIKTLRESKKLSQGDLEKRTGLLRCYTSRVENGHTVPSLETLEKYARALEVPIHEIFFEGKGQPVKLKLTVPNNGNPRTRASDDELHKFAKHFSKMDNRQRKILMAMAQRLAGL